MGYFDGLGQTIGGAISQSAAAFINTKVDSTLISVGIPSSSNLTAAEIEAGVTGSAPQESVGPKKADTAAVQNAGPAVIVRQVIPYAGIAIAIAGAYFLLKGKK